VGGGPAGLAAAAHLALKSLSVVVIERTCYDDVRIGEHLPPSAVLSLRELSSALNLEFGSNFLSAGVDAYWGSDIASHMDYFLHPGQSGINLTRPRFDAALAQACEGLGVAVLRGAILKGVTREQDGWKLDLKLDDGIATFKCKFVVDASGRSAKFARMQDSKLVISDRQIALAALGSTSVSVECKRSIVQSTEHGWWYWAPLSSSTCLCIMVTDPALIPVTGRSNLFRWWLDNLSNTVRVSEAIHAYEIDKKLYICPAHSQFTNPCHGEFWIAIGDAAFAQDPLSSRGILKAFEHGKCAAHAISRYLSGEDNALFLLARQFSEDYTKYLSTRQAYYEIEKRWPDSTFWKSRSAPGYSAKQRIRVIGA
jgi:flavin-dependent dehydrogenase